MTLLSLVSLLVACKDETVKTDPTDTGVVDTADTSDSTDTSVPCEVGVISVSVDDGETDVYYRDTFVVSFSGDGQAAGASLTLTDASGASVPADVTWSEGNVQASVSAVLDATATYTLTASVCGADTTRSFTTSTLGTPMTMEAGDLVGRTYVFRMSESTITQPPFLNALRSQLSVPILIGVTQADASTVTLLGGLGELRNDGTYRQYLGEPTWDFPAADFTENPYFEAQSARIVLAYAGADIPVENFTLSGTFTSDGSTLAEAIVTGLGDTRNMGALVSQPDNPGAVCGFAEAAGVPCEPCADGEPYCLFIVAEQIDATYVDGVTVVPVE